MISSIQGFYTIKKKELTFIAEIPLKHNFGNQICPGSIGLKTLSLSSAAGLLHLRNFLKTFEQTFSLTNLITVVASDQGYLNRIALDIHVIGGLISTATAIAPSEVKKEQVAPSTPINLNEVFPLTPITINALYKSFLELKDTRIIDNNII
ncbi:hypothetical protein G7Y89_g12593 [Cudoniella acicularis]|uniref:Uncharacterized protein n=1 Tax=Cudoniella acicularis TaxID=354080 RepID=A0A8H4VWV4_9HELO|nr:hypothetical protein G7Y89_g12593 [Cudoniella acicularis]